MEILTNPELKPVIIKTAEGFEFFEYIEVIRFEADGHNTLVYIKGREKPIKAFCRLLSIEERYADALFYRCHKSHVVNLRHVKKFNLKTNSLQLTQGIVPVSSNHQKSLLLILGGGTAL